jgi:tRNA pseudouridine55 synthase
MEFVFSPRMKVEPNKFSTAEDFQNGSLLLIDKPLDWTSFDVVNKVRGLLRKQFHFKKIKVGHAGTLDPRATGLLVICTGRMTKTIQELTADSKGYTGTVFFGVTRPSFDMETEVDATFPTSHITEEILTTATKQFMGKIQQLPPQFSAKKVDGKRAYKSARKGEKVDIQPVEIEITRFDLTRIALPEVDFEVECSKGTYIRTLAHDMGAAVDSGAYLAALRRYRSGIFHIENALSMEAFESRLNTMSTAG